MAKKKPSMLILWIMRDHLISTEKKDKGFELADFLKNFCD